MDYHLDSREHDSGYFTPSPDKDNHQLNKTTDANTMINLPKYQILESSSTSNFSSCSTSSSPNLSTNQSNSKNLKLTKINNQQIINKSILNANNETDRPPHSYIALISMAILSKIDRKILLNEIYDWVIQNFPYYQNRTDKSWRNSIRHNLSLNECFIKVGKAGNGRGYYWSIHSANLNDFKKGDFRRRQARLRAKHDKNNIQTTCNNSNVNTSNNKISLEKEINKKINKNNISTGLIFDTENENLNNKKNVGFQFQQNNYDNSNSNVQNYNSFNISPNGTNIVKPDNSQNNNYPTFLNQNSNSNSNINNNLSNDYFHSNCSYKNNNLINSNQNIDDSNNVVYNNNINYFSPNLSNSLLSTNDVSSSSFLSSSNGLFLSNSLNQNSCITNSQNINNKGTWLTSASSSSSQSSSPLSATKISYPSSSIIYQHNNYQNNNYCNKTNFQNINHVPITWFQPTVLEKNQSSSPNYNYSNIVSDTKLYQNQNYNEFYNPTLNQDNNLSNELSMIQSTSSSISNSHPPLNKNDNNNLILYSTCNHSNSIYQQHLNIIHPLNDSYIKSSDK